MIRTIYLWLVGSATDPNKVALTIKAGAATIVTILTMVLGLEHIQVGDPTVFVDAVIQVVQALALIASAGTTIYAFIRKIVLTFRGQHATLVANGIQ